MSSTSATYPTEGVPRPSRREPLIPNGILGMLIFIFTEVMFFSGLISAHAIVKSQAAGQMWPPYGQPRLPVEETALNSLALLVSGVVLIFAWFAFKRERSAARIPLFMAMLLGIAFVGFQGVEWAALLAEGLTMQSSTYGAFFYLIVGTHALHALCALGGLAWAFHRLDQGSLTSTQLGTVSAFWYFVVLVWPVLYWTVYL
ncbi:MAG: heme-copper oxidase subunit III [Longimicrobiales bacterium]|nr:heme-copper oxidase subunit III [Longimicrobiales bacterium]